ncbi:MAG: hypothetical protein KF689_12185 [Gemmatimonadaceae bacterium]|nr:hypothetical protein [Gemmatimonadaceae bacterium]MCW5827261.1 hypothetical protein [Gemmatimonadaceae bacterium]
MRLTHVALAATALALALPASADAQRANTTSGNRGQPNTTVPPFNVPTANRVKSMGNVAAELIDNRRRLGLDETALAALRELADEIDKRNEPALATFDSARTVARANNNTNQSGTLEGRATTAIMNETARGIAGLREADAERALALIPEDKHAAAKTILQNQQRDFDRAFAPRTRAGGRP